MCALLGLLGGEIVLGTQKQGLFAFQQRLALGLVRPTLEHFLEAFHHMLDDVKMIDDNLRFG